MGVTLLIIGCCVITINTITMTVKQDTRFPSFVGFPYKNKRGLVTEIKHGGITPNKTIDYYFNGWCLINI